MGMSDKVECANGNHCVREIFEQWDLNEDNVCQGCEAVGFYIQECKEGIWGGVDGSWSCPKCGNKTFLYDQDGDPVYCKECLFHVG